MGRPLKKDVNGINVIGSPAYGSVGEKDAGIICTFWDGDSAELGGIIKQRGAKTYVVALIADILEDNINRSPNKFTCTLVAQAPVADGEMSIEAQDGTFIAKITKRVMTDFAGNRYTWEMVNFEDSTGDAIVLTPVA